MWGREGPRSGIDSEWGARTAACRETMPPQETLFRKLVCNLPTCGGKHWLSPTLHATQENFILSLCLPLSPRTVPSSWLHLLWSLFNSFCICFHLLAQLHNRRVGGCPHLCLAHSLEARKLTGSVDIKFCWNTVIFHNLLPTIPVKNIKKIQVTYMVSQLLQSIKRQCKNKFYLLLFNTVWLWNQIARLVSWWYLTILYTNIYTFF